MIDATICNALLCRTSGATFTWLIKAARQSTLAGRISGRDVTPARALRGAALLIADLTGLSFDSQLRCGTLPASVDEGFSVSLTGNGKRESFDANTWNILFYGRGADSQTLLGAAEKLAAKLPLPLAVTVQNTDVSVTIHQLTCGKMQLECIGSKGSTPCTLKMELTAEISGVI